MTKNINEIQEENRRVILGDPYLEMGNEEYNLAFEKYMTDIGKDYPIGLIALLASLIYEYEWLTTKLFLVMEER